MKQVIATFKAPSIFALLLGSAGLILICALDFIYWKTRVLFEVLPIGSADYMIRSAVIFLASMAGLWGLANHRATPLKLGAKEEYTFELVSIVVALLVSACFLIMFILNPTLFNTQSHEDGYVEWVSSLLLFCCSGLTLYCAVVSRKNSQVNIHYIRLTFLLMAFVFFVMAMEEISWFQRVLDIETPAGFENNAQSELNFHNFATDYFENIYYFGGFVFLVFIPFLRYLFPEMCNVYYLKLFVGRPFLCIVGALPNAYNYDMWNIIYSQVAFFGSVIILFYLFKFSDKSTIKVSIAIVALTTILTQIIFIANGEKFARIWEVTEYKELLIPLGLMIYTIDLAKRVRSEK